MCVKIRLVVLFQRGIHIAKARVGNMRAVNSASARGNGVAAYFTVPVVQGVDGISYNISESIVYDFNVVKIMTDDGGMCADTSYQVFKGAVRNRDISCFCPVINIVAEMVFIEYVNLNSFAIAC